MKKKILLFIFAFFVTLSCMLSSVTAKAQFIPGILPNFYFENTGGFNVKVGERVLIKGYFINDGTNEVPAGKVMVDISWGQSYAVFDGFADPATGADITTPVGYTDIYHDDGVVMAQCDVPLEDAMGNWVEVAFYIKGTAVHSNNLHSNVENADNPIWDQTKSASQDVAFGTTAAKPLPITLTSFDAQKQTATSALIKWNIVDAKNFSHFELERCATGKQFSKIASVTFDEKKAAYSYSDENLLGGVYQYRLKMVDIDGKSTYSWIRTVSFDASATNVYVAPNVTKGQFYVKGLNGKALVQIADMSGKVLGKYNNVERDTMLDISSASFARGVYVIEVIQDGKAIGSYKLLKQ